MTRMELWNLDEVLSEQHEVMIHVSELEIW